MKIRKINTPCKNIACIPFNYNKKQPLNAFSGKKVFALSQYQRLKENFYQKRPIAGFKEYYDRKCLLGFDIDAGPIVFNLSPTGTAFGLGSATYFEDYEVRNGFLRTAELAGFTVSSGEQRHYLLANVALVGEAIALAMRTAVKWE